MTCYKCGKELPDGDISGECVPACAVATVKSAAPPTFILLQINLNLPAIAADQKNFDLAMQSFTRELERITKSTGLFKFCHPKP